MVKLFDLKDLEMIKENPPHESSPCLAEVRKEESAPLEKGMQVRVMDREGIATIVTLYEDYAEVDSGDLVIRIPRKDIVAVDFDVVENMMASAPCGVPQKNVPQRSKSTSSDMKIDLHIDKIPGGRNVPQRAAQVFQLEYFRSVLYENIRHRGRQITFVHGIGDGILAAKIRKELDEVFALTCRYTVGQMGITKVVIK